MPATRFSEIQEYIYQNVRKLLEVIEEMTADSYTLVHIIRSVDYQGPGRDDTYVQDIEFSKFECEIVETAPLSLDEAFKATRSLVRKYAHLLEDNSR